MTYLLLATAVMLSAVAAFYSIAGLMAIFAAAAVPIAIMGGTLEVAKIVVATWLKKNWVDTPMLLRGYFISAIFILMLITSAGIFGFLSKAYLEQEVISGDVVSKVEIIDEKLKVEKETIEVNRRALKQLDEAVDQVMIRSNTEEGASKSAQIRRSQQPERSRLAKEIEAAQKKISTLNEERAPIGAALRKVEAEVGPIKYVAALIYGEDNAKESTDKAVRILILMLVFTFDPLAVLMFIAVAQTSKVRSKVVPEEPKVQSANPNIESPLLNYPILPVEVPEEPKEEPVEEPVPAPSANHASVSMSTSTYVKDSIELILN